MKRLVHNHTSRFDQPRSNEGAALGDRIYLERAPHPTHEGHEVILAYLPDNPGTPYVTWDHAPHRGMSDSSGDYFQGLPEALAGFLIRIARPKHAPNLRVWGGKAYVDSKRKRVIVCHRSKAAAMRLMEERGVHVTANEFRFCWAETGNEIELEIATDVGAWATDDDISKDYRPL